MIDFVVVIAILFMFAGCIYGIFIRPFLNE